MKTVNSHRLAAAFTLALVVGSAVRADRPDFLVNDDGGTGQQSHPRVAVAPDGGFVIVWDDRRAGNSDIYLQRYDCEGASMSGNICINDDTGAAYQAEPAVAVDLSGSYSVVWRDYRNGAYPFDPDVFFQSFDSAVSPVGVNRNLTTEWPDSLKESPDMALSAWGGGVVVWADYRNCNWDIYGQRISALGAPVGSNFKVNDDANSAQQHAPRVSIAAQGWFVVAWYDNRWGSDDIFVQRFDSLGNPLGMNVRVNSDGTEVRQAFPDVAADGVGHFTVVWVDWRNGTYPANPDIYARKFDTAMTPLTAEIRVNKDGTARAQREPTIAADRMGNVAIIWSDSAAGSWDINGQMIDVQGEVREANFRANSDGDSAQLQADVALDGRFRYVTWADKRDGNWDVYASITKYNDPTLVPTPPALRFEMEGGGELPEPQALLIEHAGYNPLHFTVTSSVGWCSVTPASGITPETVGVAVTDGALTYGSYLGSLNLIDTDNSDSMVIVSIRLDVTVPVLALSADTLFLGAFSAIDDSSVGHLTVSNAGSGSFSWTATESADWLELSDYSGTPPSSMHVTAVAGSLAVGIYVEPVVFEAPEAIGSPDTLWIVFDVVDNQPFIAVLPDSIHVRTTDPASVEEFLVVHNRGTGVLAWHVVPGESWLVTDRAAGLAGDTVRLTIDTTGLMVGVHVGSIEFTDSASFNISQTVPFVLELVDVSRDTVAIGSIRMQAEQSAVLPVELRLVNQVSDITLPLTFDVAALSLDSVVYCSVLAATMSVGYVIDSDAGKALLWVSAGSPDTGLAPGIRLLAELHLTARSQMGVFGIDTTRFDSDALQIVTTQGVAVTPVVLSGEITIEESTDAAEFPSPPLPARFCLTQNFPNPFNLSCVIGYELPVRSELKLDVFNILGQRVATLVSGVFPVGRYSVEWGGRFDDGRAAPSGIYFYRLKSGRTSLVRKMVLVK